MAVPNSFVNGTIADGPDVTANFTYITKFIDELDTATDGATVTFDLSSANKHKVTLGGNRTLAVSGATTNTVFMVILTQDGTGSRTVTWWSGITWTGGSAPVLTTTAAKSDAFVFLCTGAGTYYGFVAGQNI
jgi:hypothetical protein